MVMVHYLLSIGTFYYGNGERYVGEILNDKRHGKGKLYYPNGDIYDGDWENDQKVGQGKRVVYL